MNGFTTVVTYCGATVRFILPYSFFYFLIDFFVSNMISICSGNGLAFRSFRVGTFKEKKGD